MFAVRRSAGLAAVAVAALWAAAPAVSADAPKTKQQLKKEQRLKAKAAAETKAAQAQLAAKPTQAQAVAQPATAKPTADAIAPAAVAKLIDQHIDRKLTEAKVAAAPACTDAEFLRRAYLDLTGVIPTADQAKQFLDDRDPLKRSRLIDQLLASENYGRHLADIWQAKLMPRESDARFVPRQPFVDWLAARFNDNTPWDAFVRQIVAGTGTLDEHPEVTFYLTNRSVDKLTDAVTQHFLGVQLQCAQCHNHPFTGWKQTEYWGMAAFFSKVVADKGVRPNKGGDNDKIGVRETAARSRQKDFFPESAKTVAAKFLDGPEPALKAAEPHRPVLATWLTARDNPYFARAMVNRTWATLLGRGFVHPVDDMHDGNEPSHPELLAALAEQFVASGFDVKALTKAICLSRAYQRTSKGATDADEALFARVAVKVLSPEQLYDSLSTVLPGMNGGGGKAAAKAGPPARSGTQRDRFVAFYLAGAEEAKPTDYEAGIPQALRLMNSPLGGNPAAVRQFAPPGAKPAEVVEKMYLATLSRRPTAAEAQRMAAHVRAAATPAEAYSDVLWALLNCSEFAMVR